MQITAGSLCVSALLVLGLLGGCAGSTGVVTEDGSGSCAFVVRFRGGNYEPVTVRIAPPEGEDLGSAVLPACDDTDDDHEAQEETIEVARLEGVSPQQAILWQGHFDKVLLRAGASLPPEVQRLMQPPPCETTDAPIRLVGTWLGIIGPGQETEVDLKPPYSVDMFVEEASEDRYERAFITVQVPRDAGQPLTREDVRESLWQGGTIDVNADCVRGAYLAREIVAHAPKQ